MTQTDPVSPAQNRAAHAYASTLLELDVAGPAAEDAVAAFRQTLAGRPPADASSTAAANDTLLALTRLMTAVSMADRSSPEDRRQAVWASIGSASHCTCREAAALLATRANNNIQPRESAALDEHLASCADCRELSVRAVAADRAFRAALAPSDGGLGLGGLPGGPRAGAALLAVVIAVAVGIVALSSGGSGSGGARAATVAAQTQTSEVVALKVPAAARPAVSAHHSVHHAVKPKVVTRHATVHRHVTKPAHAATTASTSDAGASSSADTAASAQTSAPATSSSTASSSTPGSSTASSAATGAAVTPAAAAPASAGTADTSATAPSTAAPSTAAQVSGPSSLPADSAPQQGIGSLTTTTP